MSFSDKRRRRTDDVEGGSGGKAIPSGVIGAEIL